MIHRNETWTDGVLVRAVIIDTDARTVTVEEGGEIVDTRPFTDEENAAQDAADEAAERAANEAALRANPNVQPILDAIAALRTIRDQTNPSLNTEFNNNPAAFIKQRLVPPMLTIGRRLARVYRTELGALDSTDVGDD